MGRGRGAQTRRAARLAGPRAGSRGRRIDDISSGWDVADTYGVLADLEEEKRFLDENMRRVEFEGEELAVARDEPGALRVAGGEAVGHPAACVGDHEHRRAAQARSVVLHLLGE